MRKDRCSRREGTEAVAGWEHASMLVTVLKTIGTNLRISVGAHYENIREVDTDNWIEE